MQFYSASFCLHDRLLLSSRDVLPSPLSVLTSEGGATSLTAESWSEISTSAALCWCLCVRLSLSTLVLCARSESGSVEHHTLSPPSSHTLTNSCTSQLLLNNSFISNYNETSVLLFEIQYDILGCRFHMNALGFRLPFSRSLMSISWNLVCFLIQQIRVFTCRYFDADCCSTNCAWQNCLYRDILIIIPVCVVNSATIGISPLKLIPGNQTNADKPDHRSQIQLWAYVPWHDRDSLNLFPSRL